jgi:hypothetical protein
MAEGHKKMKMDFFAKSTFFHAGQREKRASCVTFFATRGEPTPSTLTLVLEKSLTLPLPLREIRP